MILSMTTSSVVLMWGEGRGRGSKGTASFWAWCSGHYNENAKAYGAVVIIRLIYAGMFLVLKAAFDGGLNPSILAFYRQASATVILVPLALFLEWKHAPSLSLVTFGKIFVLAAVGITGTSNLHGYALLYTSTALAAASTNSIPVVTFFLALLFGAETLKVESRSGKAKLLGIVICIGGVVSLAFYEGPHFKILCLFKHNSSNGQNDQYLHDDQSHATWIKGCFLMLSSSFTWGFWIVFQARLQKSYPPKLLFTALQCALSSIQSFVVAIAVERDPDEWKLGWDMKLVAVIYCGVVVTGVTYYLQAWVLEKRGPVFLAMSTPLAFIFTMICSALLCDFINLGSILGGVILVGGLYSVLWAKVKEEKMMMMIKMEKNELKHIINPQVEVVQDSSSEINKQVVLISIGGTPNDQPNATTL